MKKIGTVLLFLFISVFLFADPISIGKAKQVAVNLLKERAENLIYHQINISNLEHIFTKKENNQDLYYVFSLTEDKTGFVIIAADDDVFPVLAYSFEDNYSMEEPHPSFHSWMDQYASQILYVKQNKLKADASIMGAWNTYLSGSITPVRGSVGPLVTSKWDQGKYYNKDCPYDAGSSFDNRALVGCVAVAMAQVMKYHDAPAQGTGNHSYYHPKYGTLSANFMTTYNWSNMPVSLNSHNSDLAKLLFHCGVSVDMNYGADGSGAYTSEAADALKTYFDYKNTTSYVEKSDYSTSAWESLLKTELDNDRPMVYKGHGNVGGHAFVCDGYQGVSNNHFHFNWGWGGYLDGYFYVSNLNPGTSAFTNYQGAIKGIEPNQITQTSDIQLYDTIRVNPYPMKFGSAATITVKFANVGTTSFTGDYLVALYDNDGTFLTTIEEITGLSALQGGYYYELDFTISNISYPAGNYYIAAWHKKSGGSYELTPEGNYENPIAVSIAGNNPLDIALYSEIGVDPDPIVEGEAFDIEVILANFNKNDDFEGDYVAFIYDRDNDDVYIVETLGNMSLDAYSYYTQPIVFSSTGITLGPGQYEVIINHRPNGGSWVYTDPYTYTNGRSVTIIPADMTPDQYEANNSEANAHTFNPVFSSGTASIKTNGSNIHNENDVDYYEIVLPTGYDYTIGAKVHDNIKSSDGNSYTNDVQFAYKNDNWSAFFDDDEAFDFNISNGGSLLFHVKPYFSGKKGTYLLEVDIQQQASKADLIIENLNVSPLSVQKGSTIQITANLKNQGNVIASSSKVKYYLSDNNTYSMDDTELGSDNIGSLNYNESHALNKSLLIPSSVNTGTYYILLITDADNQVPESDENNNLSYVQIEVVSSTGISQTTPKNKIHVYPNPASDILFFETSEDAFVHIRILDMSGKILYEDRNSCKECRIDVSNFSSGTYILEIHDGLNTYYEDILIRK